MSKTIYVAVSCAALLAGRAEVAGISNPYLSIPARNVFRLVPPVVEPPFQRPEVKPLPLPQLAVTGVTDVCGRRQVFLEVGGAGKLGKPVLEEGATLEGIRVLAIDVQAASVKLALNGIEKVLPVGSGTDNTPKPVVPKHVGVR